MPNRLQVGLVEGLLEPGVIGWMRPVLLLPADVEDHLTRPEIEAIVAHELRHVRRFDNVTAAVYMLVEAIFWFHPLVWWPDARHGSILRVSSGANDDVWICFSYSTRSA